MKKSKLLLGDEALALAACDAGVKAFYGYPGTPSTEIFEAGEIYIKKLNDGRVAEWAATIISNPDPNTGFIKTFQILSILTQTLSLILITLLLVS